MIVRYMALGKKCYSPFSSKIVYAIKGGRHFCIEKKCHLPFISNYALKGGRHFCIEKKCRPPFSNKIDY